jgi:DNA-directed RNA polymerase alpha subunit
MEILGQLDIDEELMLLTGDKIRFGMFTTPKMRETDIAELDLSVRSYNCLRRAGKNTIGDIIAIVRQEGGDDNLGKIRNCGTKSQDEIMQKLFVWDYRHLTERWQKAFLQEIRKRNPAAFELREQRS